MVTERSAVVLKSRRRKARLGGVPLLVCKNEAVQHLKQLKATGWSLEAVAKETGMSGILNIARMKQINIATRDAILGIPLGSAPKDCRFRDAKPTVKHVRGLRTAGWTWRDLAEATGVSHWTLQQLAKGQMNGRKATVVLATTANRIEAVELPPKAADDIDEVQVERLMDPHRDKPADATAAEIKRAVDILSTRYKVDRRTAAAWIHQERWRMKAA